MLKMKYEYGYDREHIVEYLEGVKNVTELDDITVILISLMIVGIATAIIIHGVLLKESLLVVMGIGIIIITAFVTIDDIDDKENYFEIEPVAVSRLLNEMNEQNYAKVIFLKKNSLDKENYIGNYLYTTPSRVTGSNFDNLHNEGKSNGIVKGDKDSSTIVDLNETFVVNEDVDLYGVGEQYQVVKVTEEGNDVIKLVEVTGAGKVYATTNTSDFIVGNIYKVLDKGDSHVIFQHYEITK